VLQGVRVRVPPWVQIKVKNMIYVIALSCLLFIPIFSMIKRMVTKGKIRAKGAKKRRKHILGF
jgi:hypothetical protein